MGELDAHVEEVLENTTAEKTKYTYLCAIARFVEWLHTNTDDDRRQTLFTSFRELQTINEGTIASWLSRPPFRSPVCLDSLSTQDCMSYLTSMEQRGVTGKSTFGNVRSAIVYLYPATEHSRPHDFDFQMRRFFRVFIIQWLKLPRTVTKVFEKEKSHSAFQCIGLWQGRCSSLPKTQDVFGNIFLLTCWNLMCRAKNSQSIRYGHISWYEDSLTITFAHMKNDQDGSRPRDPRHVYSNPIMPEVCPVLGLAIYFAVLGFSPDDKLFAGENQYSRFLEVLKGILNRDVMNVTLAEVSMSANSFGTHSARKGAATYVSGCSTSGPSVAAICLRAGWTLPGVHDKYVRYESAGDMVVGRFVAELPFDSPNFAALPPFLIFKVVKTTKAWCFDNGLKKL